LCACRVYQFGFWGDGASIFVNFEFDDSIEKGTTIIPPPSVGGDNEEI
jgi:hypothetical protein